jgi:ribonuclease D
VRDEILLAMARQPVKTVEKLDRVKGLPRPIETQYGRELVSATLAALALPRAQWPVARSHEESALEKFQTDALFAAAEAICYGQSIDPALVLSRQDIADLLRRRRAGGDSRESRLLASWRRRIVGDALLRLLAGEPAGQIRWPGK